MTLTKKQLQQIDFTQTPQSIAIIPDGNRRWAKQHGLSIRRGYEEGARKMIEMVRIAQQLGVKEITFYQFSTENWSRHATEVHTLLYLFDSYLEKKRQEMVEQGVRFHTIGDPSRLPNSLLENIDRTREATAVGKTIDVILAVNYGGRDEIRRAVRSLLDDFQQKKVKKEDITEDLLSQYLDTAPFRDPELLIRTSGEQRQSNFLIWQASYTEWAFSPKLWPDFSPEDLLHIFADYQERKRRFGT